MSDRTVLVLDPNKGSLNRLRKLVQDLGCATLGAGSSDEALRLVGNKPDLIIVSDEALKGQNEGHRQIFESLRSINDAPSPVVLVTSAGKAKEERVKALGADATLLRPLKRDVVQSCLGTLFQVRDLGDQVLRLKAELATRDDRLRRVNHVEPFDPKTNFYHFEFFKRLLVVEIRRAKRYSFPLSLLLVALDPLPELARTYSPTLARDISDGVALAISRSIRDIDLPVHYADNNILVMLPHTDSEGADGVAQRISERIKRAVYRDEKLTVRLTASIGVASFEQHSKQVSFARLIRDASLALRAAQAKGGNQVVQR